MIRHLCKIKTRLCLPKATTSQQQPEAWVKHDGTSNLDIFEIGLTLWDLIFHLLLTGIYTLVGNKKQL
jgi:hypothetical protein